MAKKIDVPFNGTKEQEAKLRAALAELKDAQFSLFPKGQYKIGVCLGTACYVKGSGDVYKKLCDTLHIEGGQCTDDLKFSLDATRCIGCCGLAPVMTINDDVYGKVTPEEVEGILAKYN